jgi:putative ABC transport system ATP-binding protein
MRKILLEAREVSVTSNTGAILLAPCSVELGYTDDVADRLAVEGPSGSGKSLLLRSLCLLEPKMQGEIRWNGQPVKDEEIPAFRAKVVYVPQKPVFFSNTVEENIRDVLTLAVHRAIPDPSQKLREWLAILGRGREFLAKEVRHLSGGEAQLAALLRTLVLEPELLCLDEPTSALDPDTCLRAENLLTTVHRGPWIWVSHDPQQIARVGACVLRI